MISVLDRGFIRHLDTLGSDLTVVNAARVSFAKESAWEEGEYPGDSFLSEKDSKLIRYLADHNHWSPFSHPQISFHFKAPIFVARQLQKHQVGFSWNEVSRRYVDDEPEFYEPEVWRSKPEGSIKQGSGTEGIKYLNQKVLIEYGDSARDIPDAYWFACDKAKEVYDAMLAAGVAPEQARMVLPQSAYTEWHWTGSLYGWSRVYKLRIDSHAQWEVQQYAKVLDQLIRPLFPTSWEALVGEKNIE